MSIPADKAAAHCNVDHGARDVDAALATSDEPAPSDHPAESACDDPTTWQDFDALLIVAATDYFEDEIQIGGFVHQLEPVVGDVGEE